MTKREPFAEVVATGIEPERYAVKIGGRYYCHSRSATQARDTAEQINAAHEARVKEAAREAGEEFRWLIITTINEHSKSVDNEWNRKSGFFDSADIVCDDLVEIIRKIPTEPEGR